MTVTGFTQKTTSRRWLLSATLTTAYSGMLNMTSNLTFVVDIIFIIVIVATRYYSPMCALADLFISFAYTIPFSSLVIPVRVNNPSVTAAALTAALTTSTTAVGTAMAGQDFNNNKNYPYYPLNPSQPKLTFMTCHF